MTYSVDIQAAADSQGLDLEFMHEIVGDFYGKNVSIAFRIEAISDIVWRWYLQKTASLMRL